MALPAAPRPSARAALGGAASEQWRDVFEQAPLALRYASAGLGAQANVLGLAGRSSNAAIVARGKVSALRVVGDARDLFRDARALRQAPTAARRQQLAETAMRSVGHQAAALRGLAALRSVGSASRLVPGASAVAAAADAGVAAAAVASDASTPEEKVAATLTAVMSAVASTALPVIAQVGGLAAIGLSLWRDAENDAGRQRSVRAAKEAARDRR